MSGAEEAVERLAIKAERIALARAETIARTSLGDGAYWRRPDLLWPVAAHD